MRAWEDPEMSVVASLDEAAEDPSGGGADQFAKASGP